MKKITSFFILLLHINSSMFFPVVEEKDFFDHKGKQVEDINTVVELIFHSFSSKPTDPLDEDSDQPQFLQTITGNSYLPGFDISFLLKIKADHIIHVTLHKHDDLPLINSEITSPPPEEI